MIRLRFGTTILQVRRATACVGAACLLFAFTFVYIFFGRLLPTDLSKWSPDKVDVVALEKRLEHLEQELRQNHQTLGQIRDTVRDLLRDGGVPWRVGHRPHTTNASRQIVTVPPADCIFGTLPPANTDFNMYEVYEKLSFDNPNGGVWKQGWDLQYLADQWTPEKKLRVIVVPHSHNDPGWIKTFEKYYDDQTRHILDNMVSKLAVDRRRKFIWAEVSYFSVWFENQSDAIKAQVRGYLQNGQLEIVTGGWVMNDEANTHVSAMIEQMVEGHQWLKHNVGVKPKNGWAIDPFGLSPTMAYLLKRMGFQNMVIQRVHYSIKKYLAHERSLEFIWRQSWDHNHTTDILCHMMPFYSYDVPHTCGPDPKVCCQFDFKRLPGNKVNCPWRVAPVPITDKNVASKAMVLLDQYRKKAQLFRTHTVLVPLGDDFRFDKANEWDNQFSNYQRLFDYVNSHPELHAELRFGTLNDYFTALREETSVDAANMPLGFPSMSGDFFTYADRDDNYWSGYYTSRPFYKNMDRVVEAHLRGAEILFSLVWARMGLLGMDHSSLIEEMMLGLVGSRRNLGLFQHHDAITGTAKDAVVIDYGKRLLESLKNLRDIIAKSAHYMLLNTQSNVDVLSLSLDDVRDDHNAIAHKVPLTFTKEARIRYVVVYNSLAVPRNEIITVHVTSPSVVVVDSNGTLVPSQLSPVWEGREFVRGVFELCFLADVPALGLTTYRVEQIDGVSGTVYRAAVTLYSSESYFDTLYFPVTHADSKEDIKIQSPYIAATFSATTGMLKHVEVKEHNVSLDVQSSFVMYGTRPKGKDQSGAYLFLPQSEAFPVEAKNAPIRIIEGDLYSELTAFLPNVEFHVKLKNSPGMDGVGLEVYNVVDITSRTNHELVMRLTTGVHNFGPEFYTDVNGLLMARRHTQEKLTLQGNVYPMPTIMFIQDNSTRLTVLTAQPLGTTSLKTGVVDVFLDRRLNQDDKRGLQQGVKDNLKTPSSFRILIERFNSDIATHSREASHPSLLSQHASMSLLHPPFVLLHSKAYRLADPPLRASFAGSHSLPCDIHMLNLRTLSNSSKGPSNVTAMFLQRLPHDCRLKTYAVRCAFQPVDTLADIFPDYYSNVYEETSLSLMHTLSTSTKSSSFNLPPPAEIAAYKLQRR
uniref:Alpha-mannosidase n=1 Tax=Ornithodoros turicata TaxID=34597 RepID=A0A2R5LA05_9ACAR